MTDIAPVLTDEIRDAAHVLWRYHSQFDELSEADAIVGLGSYDLRVAQRCADLYRNGYARRIVVTGSFGNWTRGKFQKTEASTFKELIEGRGVPATQVLCEERATNIGENIHFSKGLLEVLPVRRIIFVTKPQTIQRVKATVPVQWPSMQFLVTAPLLSFCEQPTDAHPMEQLIEEMVGDLARIKSYPERGFQVALPIPDCVDRAFEYLMSMGFTSFLPQDL